jgi:hypothetical protein
LSYGRLKKQTLSANRNSKPMPGPEQTVSEVRANNTGRLIGVTELEPKIRERWGGSRANRIKLLPRPAHLQVFDNSAEVTPGADVPDPVLVLEMVGGRMVVPEPLDATALHATPEWARPIVQAAIEFEIL